MRTSEILKEIKNNPIIYLAWLKCKKESGQVNECRNGKLWRTHNVKHGIDHWKVYYNDKVIKRGISK